MVTTKRFERVAVRNTVDIAETTGQQEPALDAQRCRWSAARCGGWLTFSPAGESEAQSKQYPDEDTLEHDRDGSPGSEGSETRRQSIRLARIRQAPRRRRGGGGELSSTSQ